MLKKYQLGGVFSFSSSPLTTLMPQTSPYRIPDYANALKAAGDAAGLSAAKTAKAGAIGGTIGAAADMLGSFLPQKTEYVGPKGDITQTMDSVYDGIADAAMEIPGLGPLVGGVMKGGAFLGKGMNALGGGTDGMTTTDAILGSSFLNLTPIGLINGFGGKKADTITKDNQAFETVGASYTGSSQTVDEALQKSGKKYGLFSSGARKEANQEIAEAKRQQNVIADIAGEAVDRNTIKYAMSSINGNRRAFNMQGGYDQSAIRVGRHGMSLEKLNAAMKVVKAQKGTKIKGIRFSVKPNYNEWLDTVPQDRLNPNYDLETAYKYLPLEILEDWRLSTLKELEEGKNHLWSVAPIEGTEDYIFLKKGVNDLNAPNYNPELHFETNTYYDGSNGLKETHDLIYDGDRYYYRKKKTHNTVKNSNSEENTPEFKEGGSIELIDPRTIIEEDDSTIELVNPLDITEEDIEEFKEGGSVNTKYKVVTVQDEPWADDYFKKNPTVSGMAIGAGMNGIDGERRIILNPYSENINKESVIKNESLRHWMDENNFELPDVSEDQLNFYKGTTYEGNKLNIGRTEAARYLSGDKHHLSEKQIKYLNSLTIPQFKEGGSINVIPDGSLHARLHHMKDADDLTKKGIPVVDNDGEQQAEVEREELIFRLEVTKKLEELEKKYYQEETSQKEKDELALEAGKLLTEEILHNTQDNTNNLL